MARTLAASSASRAHWWANLVLGTIYFCVIPIGSIAAFAVYGPYGLEILIRVCTFGFVDPFIDYNPHGDRLFAYSSIAGEALPFIAGLLLGFVFKTRQGISLICRIGSVSLIALAEYLLKHNSDTAYGDIPGLLFDVILPAASGFLIIFAWRRRSRTALRNGANFVNSAILLFCLLCFFGFFCF